MNRTWMPSQAASSSSTTSHSNATTALVLGQDQALKSSAHLSKAKEDAPKGLPHVKEDVLSFRNMHEYGTLLTSYLEARKQIFVDELHWKVSEADGMEFDQYDTPFARWVILHQYGEILGSVRMLPTTAQCATYSYMLRDAQRGILEDLPTDVLFFPAPVEHNVWEATRFFITDAVPASNRQEIQTLLFRAMSRTAMENGASYIMGIVPAVWARWARRINVAATPIGAKFSIEGTVSQAVLFEARDYLV